MVNSNLRHYYWVKIDTKYKSLMKTYTVKENRNVINRSTWIGPPLNLLLCLRLGFVTFSSFNFGRETYDSFFILRKPLY